MVTIKLLYLVAMVVLVYKKTKYGRAKIKVDLRDDYQNVIKDYVAKRVMSKVIKEPTIQQRKNDEDNVGHKMSRGYVNYYNVLE